MGPLIAPILDLCVPPHGFQIQCGSLACTLTCLHVVNLRFMCGITPAFSTNRGVHCINVLQQSHLPDIPNASSRGYDIDSAMLV